ncbi:MAG: hypothetical protein HY360_19815 [Verrucomicrobia bacterium]|nr:hypothetical protein [Verrucomicrobiota bacterium]
MKFHRYSPEGNVPLLSFEGSSFECGQQLGLAWQHSLKLNAAAAKGRWIPWWWKGRGGIAAAMVARVAPHLVDLIRGMAAGAGIDESLCGYSPIAAPLGPEHPGMGGLESCTSFAIHPDQTLDGHAISGQTKDTGFHRTSFYQVLRLKPNDAPGHLTLTYPGELLGHGFAQTGMSLFRNSLFATPRKKSAAKLSFDAFGLLALFSRRLDDVIEMARRHRVQTVAHITVAEASGQTAGFEFCDGRMQIIPARKGIYAHANHVVGGKLKPLENAGDRKTSAAGASSRRQKRLYELMEQNRGRLTPQIMLQNLSDHENYPLSICAHRDKESHTTACVIAEPTRGLLHVTRGAPCQNWPITYRL